MSQANGSATKTNSPIRFAVFQYDIPVRVTFPNPTGYLRKRHKTGKVFAFKTQYSMWLCDADNPPYTLQNRMEKAGCTVDLYPLDPAHNAAYLARAARQMRWELEQQKAREAKALKRVDDKLAEAEAEHTSGVIGWDKLSKARADHRKERDKILKRSEKLVEDLEAAAEQFGIDAPTDLMQATMARAEGIRQLGSLRAEMYTELAIAVQGTPMEAAARESEVPAGVLADYAEEHGVSTEAARAAFATDSPSLRVNSKDATDAGGAVATVAVAAPTQTAATQPAPAPTQPRTFELRSDANGLTYKGAWKQFSAEASVLGLTYSPVTIRVISHRTGNAITLQRVEVARDAEQGVTHCDYEGQGFKFRLYND